MIKHFSATVYVVKLIDGEPKVLLHLHKKHNQWFGLGGHVESDEDPVEAAKREAKEEAGIEVTIFSNKKLLRAKYANELIAPALLFDQQIDARDGQPEHRHLDCIYFGTTADPSLVKMNEQFKWFSMSELDTMELHEDTRYIAKEAINCFTNL